jgi:hypothetical protein
MSEIEWAASVPPPSGAAKSGPSMRLHEHFKEAIGVSQILRLGIISLCIPAKHAG